MDDLKKTKATLDLLVAGISVDQADRNHVAAQANLTAAFAALQNARRIYLDAHAARHGCEVALKEARKAHARAKLVYDALCNR